MMRQVGGSFGIAFINTFLDHHAAAHRLDLVSKLAAGDAATDGRLSQLARGMLAAGATPWEAPRRALAALEATVQRQAGLLSYLDAFRLVGTIALWCVPLILLAGRTRRVAQGRRRPPPPTRIEPGARILQKPSFFRHEAPSVLSSAPRFPACSPRNRPAPGPLSLDQAIQAVLVRYPSLDAAQAAIDAARGRFMQSNAARLPQISANGAYTYQSLRPYINFSLPGSPPTAFYENIQNSYNATLNVRQLLTDFGRTDALVAMARAGQISARDALDQVRNQLGYSTIQAFYGVILLQASDAVADEEIRALLEALRISEKKFNGGTATKFDLLTTQVRLANARNRRTDTEAALAKQEIAAASIARPTGRRARDAGRHLRHLHHPARPLRHHRPRDCRTARK